MIANMRYKLAVAAAYLTLMALFIYHFIEVPGDLSNSVFIPVVLGSQLVVGLAIGRWWALLLPCVVLVLLLPGGNGNSEIPLWFGIVFIAVFTLPLVGLGVIVRRVGSRLNRVDRGSPRAPGTSPLVPSRR
jgi:hypothetical protein